MQISSPGAIGSVARSMAIEESANSTDAFGWQLWLAVPIVSVHRCETQTQHPVIKPEAAAMWLTVQSSSIQWREQSGLCNVLQPALIIQLPPALA